MGRLRRSELKATRHHVFNRGARRLNVFGDDRDRERFLELLGSACTGPRVLAYALLGNHYHLVIHAPGPELSGIMKALSENFTRWFNAKYGFDGPLFRSRFGSKPITSTSYLRQAIRYVHTNPVKDGIGDWSYPWSGHRLLLGDEAAPSWFAADTTAAFGGPESYRAFVEGDLDPQPLVVRERVRVGSPEAVELALGIDSREELAVVARGGRGLRNDLRSAAALLASETTSWGSARLAARYGYSSGSNFRVAVNRARRRLETDPAFAELVEHGRIRLSRCPRVGEM